MAEEAAAAKFISVLSTDSAVVEEEIVYVRHGELELYSLDSSVSRLLQRLMSKI